MYIIPLLYLKKLLSEYIEFIMLQFKNTMIIVSCNVQLKKRHIWVRILATAHGIKHLPPSWG